MVEFITNSSSTDKFGRFALAGFIPLRYGIPTPDAIDEISFFNRLLIEGVATLQ